MNKRALDGIRVIDLTQVIMGPACTAILADHGAEVIKIERPPDGDLARSFGPFKNDRSLSYACFNRNKKSVAVNLKDPKGLGMVLRMLDESDVVVNNFRPGVMESLGLGYSTLRKRNPGLIFASGTGYGSTGPLAESRKAGHDTMAQALSGVMASNAGVDGVPRRIPLAVADITAGNLLVQGILMALYWRERTGEGQHVEVSLLDSMLWMEGWRVTGAANQPPADEPRHGANPLDGGIYKTRDGYIVVTGLFKANPLKAICEVLGIADLSMEDRFSNIPAMVAHADELRALLQEPISATNSSKWVEAFEEADILCAPILTLDEAIDHPQTVHNDMVVDAGLFGGTGVRLIGVPVKLNSTPGSVRTPPPEVGQHTNEVLRGFNVSESELKELERAGVIMSGGNW